MDPDILMQAAIEAAQRGIEAGQSPFGCAIGQGDTILVADHNRVLATPDITAHAEINALRAACRKTGQILLEGCLVASTCEPCPMCMSALHWARVDVVYYGATIQDASAAGFNELTLPAREVLRLGRSCVRLVPGTQSDACRTLFQQWITRADRRSY